ncbi:MAG: hypothetical protein JF617_16820, partial [Burkholderiales bacterium]|nr:hypothetical protein [Burkholderiales bacterium]
KRWGLTDPKAGTAMDRRVMQDHLDRLAIQFGYDHLASGDPAVAWASYADVLRQRPWRLKLWPAATKALVKRVLS